MSIPSRAERPAIAAMRLSTEAFWPTSFRRTDALRMGFKMSIRSMIQRICGFQSTASHTPRAADGVITSYETRSTFVSGRVKQARSPQMRSWRGSEIPLEISALGVPDPMFKALPAQLGQIDADRWGIQLPVH